VSIDLGSPVLEIAVGLAFIFFLLSTVVSAVTEGLAWLTRQRAKQLEDGVKGLLGDNELAKEVLDHSLVQSDVRGPARRRRSRGRRKKPSYVSARNFSLALIDTLAKRGATGQDPLEEVEHGASGLGDEALEEQLGALFGDPAVTDLSQFRKSVEEWFDDAMDRVSGWYKRWAQKIACITALVVTVVLNVNAIKVAETLANEETVRVAVAAKAEAPGGGDATASGENAEYAVKTLESLKLPVLWNDATDDVDASVIAGWLITAIAISLGAPFWFDALSKLARLRTTGKKPEAAKAT
jgi:hypothetical protein